jgi:uncharacterized protein (DUF2147 family)
MVIGMILAVATQAAAQPPASIEGHWRSPGGNSIIVIGPCGSSMCGTVEWASAKAKQDASKHVDKLVGTQLLTALQQNAKGGWQGKLFIPDKNIRATAKIAPVGDQQLKVSGCLAGKALCKAELWTRTDGTVPSGD